MTEQEIRTWLEGEIRNYPERATGNACGDFIVRLAGRVVESHRQQLLEAMRSWISERSGWTLLAVRMASEHQLRELKPDIERLLEDVRAHRVFSRYYEEFITAALARIKEK